MRNLASPYSNLASLYKINEQNLALRRDVMGLTTDDAQVLRELTPWE